MNESWVEISSIEIFDFPHLPDVHITLHALMPDGAVSEEVLATTECRPGNSLSWHFLTIHLKDRRLAVVVHSHESRQIAYTEFTVEESVHPNIISNRLTLCVPTFDCPTITIRAACCPHIRISYFPLPICVQYCLEFGGVPPTSLTGEFRFELRIVDRGERITSVRSRPVVPTLMVDSYMLLSDERLELFETLNMANTSKKIEVLLVTSSAEVRLIDVSRLHKLQLDSAIPVGTREGVLQISASKDPRIPRCPDLMLSNSRRCKLVCARLELVGIPHGTLSAGVVGFGHELLCADLAWKRVSIENGRGDLQLEYYEVETAPAVAGIIVRNVSGAIIYLYKVALIDGSHQEFFDNPVVISVAVNPIEFVPKYLPLAPDSPNRFPFKEGSMVRVVVTVRSVCQLPHSLRSGFVAVRTVAVSLCPLLLRMTEVIDMQPLELPPESTACTASRERTGNPIFESDLQIDVPFHEADWLYFVLFDNGPESTQVVAHACVPFSKASSSANFRLPVVDVDTCIPFPGSFLAIEFPSDPIHWQPIVVRQVSESRYVGEVCLHVEAFRERPGKTELPAVRTNHIWLPIKPIHPLYLMDCPPSGFVKLTLKPLNGNTLSESVYAFSGRDSQLLCGQIEFSFSRNS